MYEQLSPSFAGSSGVRQGLPISPFLLKFTMDDPLQWASDDAANFGVEHLPGPRVADGAALLGDDPQASQSALNHLTAEATMRGINFAISKRRVLFQDWHEDPVALSLWGTFGNGQ